MLFVEMHNFSAETGALMALDCEPYCVYLERPRQTMFVDSYIKFREGNPADIQEIIHAIQQEAGGAYTINIYKTFVECMSQSYGQLFSRQNELEDAIEFAAAEETAYERKEPDLEVELSIVRVAMVRQEEGFAALVKSGYAPDLEEM